MLRLCGEPVASPSRVWGGLFAILVAVGQAGAAPTRSIGLDTQDAQSSHDKLRVGFCVEEDPYAHMDARGQVSGLAEEYVEIAAQRVGLRVEKVPAKDLEELKQLVQADRIDAVAAATAGDFAPHDMIMSRPYESFPLLIIARTDGTSLLAEEDLSGRKVAIRNHPGLASQARMAAPQATIELV